jgi:hypothetical protein
VRKKKPNLTVPLGRVSLCHCNRVRGTEDCFSSCEASTNNHHNNVLLQWAAECWIGQLYSSDFRQFPVISRGTYLKSHRCQVCCCFRPSYFPAKIKMVTTPHCSLCLEEKIFVRRRTITEGFGRRLTGTPYSVCLLYFVGSQIGQLLSLQISNTIPR